MTFEKNDDWEHSELSHLIYIKIFNNLIWNYDSMMCINDCIYNVYYSLWLIIVSNNIIVELNKGEKLNYDNYNIWHLKLQFVLKE